MGAFGWVGLMGVNWKYWLDCINYHWASITVFSGLAMTSMVKVLPVPGTPFQWYPFLYDWIHQFLNMPNNRLTPKP